MFQIFDEFCKDMHDACIKPLDKVAADTMLGFKANMPGGEVHFYKGGGKLAPQKGSSCKLDALII